MTTTGRQEGDGADTDAAPLTALVAGLAPGAQALVRQSIAAARAAEESAFGYLGGLVNMRTLDAGDDDLALAMDVTAPALNRYGYVHGGILFTLADYAMGAIVRRLIGEDAHAVTLEAKANYLTNVKEGGVIARCTALHQTTRLVMRETRIVDAATDALMMIVTGTYDIIPREADGADGDE